MTGWDDVMAWTIVAMALILLLGALCVWITHAWAKPSDQEDHG